MAKRRNVTEWSKWYVVTEGGQKRIKRWRSVDGKTKWQRYPAKAYLKLEEQEFEALLRRINASHEIDRKTAEERYNFDHTYVNQISLQKFEKKVSGGIRGKLDIGTVMQCLKDYVLAFFILKEGLPDPSRWHLKEGEWGSWLMEQDLSPRSLRRVVATANRFTTFLVQYVYPDMETPRKLDPLGENDLRKLEKTWALKFEKKTKYIDDKTWTEILKHTEAEDPDVVPNMRLAYSFGLRISETLGFTKDKFKKGYVDVDEQGDRIDTRVEVKTDPRKVPYWFMSSQEAWDLVKQVQPMHHNTLIKRVNACLAGFKHTSHDFRRTFITRAFRLGKHWKDVMLAAGHKDIRTTMLYNQDDREQSDELADIV